MWKVFVFSIVGLALSFSCSSPELGAGDTSQVTDTVVCTDSLCYGSYVGPEFSGGSDVAHQFSNTMSRYVGDKLKAMYQSGQYAQVDFDQIEMSTKGMGSGTVVYSLSIPFKLVKEKCQAYTSFDHVGGWNHTPALAARKAQLQSALLPGDSLYISSLKTTAEGLQEHWIQWRNKMVQADCEER